MRLKALLKYETIVIQCHDNPDADAVASGFGLYTYFKKNNKNVRFVYGGRFVIQKSNLVLMLRELAIPIEYVTTLEPPDLLITVDCQYNEGNVTHFDAKEVAVIDHHQVSGALPRMSDVRSSLGSCSTLVRVLLEREGMDINEEKNLATALYYGLMMDTNQFTEIYHPLDKDLRDDAAFDRSKITMFRNANLSLAELEIAGEALCRYEYEETHRYAVVKARACDPNILGIIGDMMLAVDAVDFCVVYSILPVGVKLSVRSCRKDTRASELADYLTDKIGSGGGHVEKAGGLIQLELLQREYCEEYHSAYDAAAQLGAFFKKRLRAYFEESEVIYAKDYVADLSQMRAYRRKNLRLGYVKASDVFKTGTKVTIRTLEGDLDMPVKEDMYITIGMGGEVRLIAEENFRKSNRMLDEPYLFEGEYKPMVRTSLDGKNVSLIPYAKTCIATGGIEIYIKPLTHRVKVFTEWDEENYMLGRAGDYLAVRKDDLHNVYVIAGDMFEQMYEAV